MARTAVGQKVGVLVSVMLGTVFGATVPIVTTVQELGDKISVIEGEREDSGFALACRPVGDVNGDGRADFAFSGERSPEDSSATAFIFLGRSNLQPRFELSQWQTWGIKLVAQEQDGDRSPMPWAGLGDLDGDGFDDMAFSMPGAPQEPCPTAGALILFGSGGLPDTISTSNFAGLRVCEVFPDRDLQGLCARHQFAAGDVNGDGLSDLLIGMPNNNRPDWIEGEGLVYVVFGARPFPAAIDLTNLGADHEGCRISAFTDWLPDTNPPTFGSVVISGHDFDRDGIDDLVTCAPFWTYDLSGTGRGVCGGAVFVIFGRAEWPAELDIGLNILQGERTCRIFSTTDGSKLGGSLLSVVDDVTGDGVPDLFVSAAAAGFYLVSGADLRPGDFLVDAIAKTRFVGDMIYGLGSVTALPDRTGDALNDLVFGCGGASHSAISEEAPGALCFVPGRAEYSSTSHIRDPQSDLATVFGPSNGAHMGDMVLGADVDGDGLSDIVATAPGRRFANQTQLDPRGRVYILSAKTGLLGPLVGEDFSPKASNLTGGGRLTVRGRGFDERTAVVLGDVTCEPLERPDSRRLIVRIPSVQTEGNVRVRIKRGMDSVTLDDQFVYFASLFPYESDVDELEDKGCVITEPTYGQGEQKILYACAGAGDFNGDQRSDVLFAYAADYIARFQPPLPGRVFLLHGSGQLPPDLLTSDVLSLGTVLTSENERGFFGLDALLVGDMNGDGISELAITEPLTGTIYVLFGHEIAKGEIVIQELIAEGHGFMIEGCPVLADNQPAVSLLHAGDLNGDVFQDFGIVTDLTEISYGGSLYHVASVAFVRGQKSFPARVPYEVLPRVYGKLPTAGLGDAYVHVARGVSDIDGDGFDDVAMTCSAERDPEVPGAEASSSFYLFFGRAVFQPETIIDAELTTGGAVEVVRYVGGGVPPGWWANFEGIGDQNGDGKADLGLTSSRLATYGGDLRDVRLLVLYGRRRSDFVVPRDISKDSDFDVVFPASPQFNAGLDIQCSGRDIDEDGWPDILIRDRHDRSAVPPSRAICLFGGELEKKAAPMGAIRDCYQIVNYHTTVDNPPFYGLFPSVFRPVGDANGDGHEDVMITTAGRIYVCYNPLSWVRFDRPFVRGDANQDGAIDIADAIRTLQFLFAHGRALPCMDASDTNDDETVNIADAIRVLGFLFGSGVKPPLPPPNQCGPDPQGDTLDCRDSLCP